MVKENFSSIIFLMETKCSVTQMEKIKIKIGVSYCFTMSSVGREGGLALPWFDGIELEIVN